jgi:hypothetical protein
MSYLIAIVSDRIQAEASYTALEKAGIPTENLTILGKGYKTADEFGFIDPSQQAKKQALQMAVWLVPFGFAAGYLFNSITQLDTFDWAGEPGNHILGGVAGAIAATMGSIFVGGGVGFAYNSGDALPYRNRLNEGKYLVIVRGDDPIKNKATEILRQFQPESLQGYTDFNSIHSN